MNKIKIRNKKNINEVQSFWDQGFKPFFMGATIFSIITLIFWTLIYSFKWQIHLVKINIIDWHSHEIIFGYCLAVIAGFLLTAIPNWTGIKTIGGYQLGLVFSTWVIARILFLFGSKFIILTAFADLLFSCLLIIAVTIPIIKSKNWQQLGILSKLLLLGVFNLGFYLNIFGMIELSTNWPIYGAFYVIISLIMTISSRVLPSFIANGVAYPVKISEPKVIRLLSLILFIFFLVTEVFIKLTTASLILTLSIFLLYSFRLYYWYSPGIWKKPLLWSHYLAILFITIGFLLLGLSYCNIVSKFLAIHSMAIGGIGLVTLSFMARVSLGHTGRNIQQPPKLIRVVLLGIVLAAVFRVFMPMLLPSLYATWILLSQVLWILSFVIFLIIFIPVWRREV